jgi:hypothetical protein
MIALMIRDARQTDARAPQLEYEPHPCQNTNPELIVRRLLHRLGHRFRLHVKNLPGKRDILLLFIVSTENLWPSAGKSWIASLSFSDNGFSQVEMN